MNLMGYGGPQQVQAGMNPMRSQIAGLMGNARGPMMPPTMPAAGTGMPAGGGMFPTPTATPAVVPTMGTGAPQMAQRPFMGQPRSLMR